MAWNEAWGWGISALVNQAHKLQVNSCSDIFAHSCELLPPLFSGEQTVSCRLYGHMPFPIEDFNPIKGSPPPSSSQSSTDGASFISEEVRRQLFDDLWKKKEKSFDEITEGQNEEDMAIRSVCSNFLCIISLNYLYTAIGIGSHSVWNVGIIFAFALGYGF